MPWVAKDKYREFHRFSFTKKYRCDAGTGYNYEIKNVEPCVVLVPFYLIKYTYNEKEYKIAVRGYNSLIASGDIPIDETKVKGLLNKFRAGKEKKQYKNTSREAAENRWIERFAK